MNNITHPFAGAAETPAQPSWLLEPAVVLSAMLDRGLLMFRPYGGPYLLADPKRAGAPIFVSDAAVDFLLERGLLTRVDEAQAGENLYLLTAEGRRTGAVNRPERP